MMRSHGFWICLGLLLAVSAVAHAQSDTEVVGSSASVYYQEDMTVGNIFTVEESRVLTNFRQQVNSSQPQDVTLFIYVQQSGAFQLLWRTTVSLDDSGAQWANSGNIVVPLEGGRTYAFGLSASSINYYAASSFSPQPVAFGEVSANFEVSAAATSFQAQSVDTRGIFSQRVTSATEAASFTDSDGDGLSDLIESLGPQDVDGDGLLSPDDPDSDGDGIPDGVEGAGDFDGDGVRNFQDSDADGDGIFDHEDPETPGMPAASAILTGLALLGLAVRRGMA